MELPIGFWCFLEIVVAAFIGFILLIFCLGEFVDYVLLIGAVGFLVTMLIYDYKTDYKDWVEIK